MLHTLPVFLGHGIQNDCSGDQDAFHDQLVLRGQMEQVQDVIDQAHDDRTDQRPGHRSDSAEKTGSPDNDRRDGVEFITFPNGWHTCYEPCHQDHACKTPTFGGGLGIGYKVPLSNKETPWGIEFGIGGGVLPLYYDYYFNIRNGRLAGEDQRTYFGVDQAFVSFTYSLGGAKKQAK